MDFPLGEHKSLGIVLREIGIGGIENEVKIIIFFCFIDYPGPDPKLLYFSDRTVKEIEESVNSALGKHNRQVGLAIEKLIEFGFIRKVRKKYELTLIGEGIARSLYDLNSIASENYFLRRGD